MIPAMFHVKAYVTHWELCHLRGEMKEKSGPDRSPLCELVKY